MVMSRYKFVSKMLSGKNRVLEIGCGDAFCTRIVLQEVGHVSAIDFDPMLIEDANQRMEEKWSFDCWVHDIAACSVEGTFNAAYAIDVIEHISLFRRQKIMRINRHPKRLRQHQCYLKSFSFL